MRAFLVHAVIFAVVLLSTNIIFNHVNPWAAFAVPVVYMFFFTNINNKINEKFS